MQRNIEITNKGLQNVNPRELGEEFCSPDFVMGPSYRPYYLLHYVFSGKGVFNINHTDYPAGKGQLSILRPYDVMNYRTDPADPWHYCWVGFETDLDIPVLRSVSLLEMQQAEHIFHALKNADLIGRDREYYICGKLYELITLFQQMDTRIKNRTVDLLFKVKHLIDTRFASPLSIEQIADDLAVNRSYFSTAFRRHIGRSPQQYLMDVRLEHAAELLVSEGCPVGEAAARSGYADVYHFSKMFKKKYGVSPLAYQNRAATGGGLPSEPVEI